MTHASLPGLAADDAAAAELLHTLLDVALTGFILFRPVYEAGGPAIADLAYEYLNPAAQQMLRLPERPTESFLALYPHARATGIFDFYCAAFLSDAKEQLEADYQHDGLDGYFRLTARRSGPRLVVSFTDTNDHPRTAIEEALRQRQAQERQAREAAETELSLLQTLISQAPVAIGLFRGDDCVVAAANDRLCAMWGYPAAAVLGRPLLAGVPELRGQGFVELVREVARTGVPFRGTEVPAELRQNDQLETHYFNFVYQPLYSASGQVLGVIDIAADVTEQVLARQQVQALNAALEARVAARTAEVERQRGRLAGFLAQAPAAICVYDGPDFVFELVNETYQTLFSGRPLLGRRLLDALPELAGQPAWQALRRVYDTGIAFEAEAQLVPVARHAGGPLEDRYFTFLYQARTAEQGRIDGVLVFAFEVTAQVRAQQQARAQRAELQRVLEQAPVAIGILRGPEFVVELANAALGTIWGRPVAQVLGQPFFEALPDLRGQGFEQLFADTLALGQALHLTEVPVQLHPNPTSPPTTGYFNCSYQPWHNVPGTAAAGMIAVAVDVTEQVLARQQLRDLNHELTATNSRLTHTNTDLDTFVYTASHDLKAPITNIEGLLLALREQLPPAALAAPQVAQLLHLLQNSVERFQQTIGHLADIAELQHAAELPAEPVDIAAVVADVYLDLAPLLLATHATGTPNVAEGLRVRCAPKTLRSVVYNLVSNAAKYHAPGRPPVVQLHAYQQAGQVVLAVHDNGLGLSPEQQGKLFRMFQRLHTHVEGSGVGLYMVKRLVENAGGTIAVASEPGVGSTFTVRLPAA